MATVIDPICGMRIEADDAAAIAEHQGDTHYFCSEACRDIFVADPSGHGAPAPAGTDADLLTEDEVAERAGTLFLLPKARSRGRQAHRRARDLHL